MPILVLAVLYAIAGFITIINGAIFLMAAVLGEVRVLGIIMIIVAILYLILAWGLWTLKPWVKTRGIIPPIIGLLAFPFGTIISIILIILWLLFRQEVNNALG